MKIIALIMENMVEYYRIISV